MNWLSPALHKLLLFGFIRSADFYLVERRFGIQLVPLCMLDEPSCVPQNRYFWFAINHGVTPFLCENQLPAGKKSKTPRLTTTPPVGQPAAEVAPRYATPVRTTWWLTTLRNQISKESAVSKYIM